MIEIFRFIREKIHKTKFIVVGDGTLRNKLKKEAERAHLDVLFTGWINQSEVMKYMNAMDVMIIPSRNEGFVTVCIEAQACGTCVIGSSNGGIPEAVGFEEFIVNEGLDFERRFAQKVVEVLQKGYDRNRLIERVKAFTWENIVQREIQVYREILRC